MLRGTTLVLALLALVLLLTGRTGRIFRGQLQGSNAVIRSFHHPASLGLTLLCPFHRSIVIISLFYLYARLIGQGIDRSIISHKRLNL